VVTIHEIGGLDDANFTVTEFVEGETLRQLMSLRGIDLVEALELSLQIASALDAALTAGIVHRDIKPEMSWPYQPARNLVSPSLSHFL
jgi:serine/threonine protein kinase